MENYLPNSLKKYNLDYETVRKLNPRLIYASITGYGQTGPYSNRPGFDVMVEAEFGLMWLTGERDRPPVKVGVAVTDLTTGLYACNSIMAALLARGVTDEGQHLDVCLSDCQVATLANMGSSVLISGKKDSGRWGTAHRMFLSISVSLSPSLWQWMLTRCYSLRRPLSRLQNRRRQHSHRRSQRPPLRHPMRKAQQTRTQNRPPIPQ